MFKRCFLLLSMLIVLCPVVSIAVAQDKPLVSQELALACLDTVWNTINEQHFDSTFGGLNWDQVYTDYRQRILSVESDDELTATLNEMVQELGLSHYAVFKLSEKKGGIPIISEGSLGLEARIIDGETVVTRVLDSYPASAHGLKLGMVLTRINGESVTDLLAEISEGQTPQANERDRLNALCDAVQKQFYGEPGDTVTLSYLNYNGHEHHATLTMQSRGAGHKIDDGFPPVYVDFEVRRLDGNIGYIFFNAFLPPADSLFINAIRGMLDIDGLIIDIRGNPGGMHTVGETIASTLMSDSTLFSIFEYRDSVVEVMVGPDGEMYTGPVVILIDVTNGSASERFSGCMQSIGRASIIGEQSSGSVGPSNMTELPNGATLMYLVAQSKTSDGTILEGRGVVPNITVHRNETDLQYGIDTQLEAAVKFLHSQKE